MCEYRTYPPTAMISTYIWLSDLSPKRYDKQMDGYPTSAKRDD